MILSIVLSINLLLLIFTGVSPLKIHWFERIFIWVVVTFIHQMFYYVVTMNLQLWITPVRLDLFWELVFTRLIAMPLLILWLVELTRRNSSLLVKAALFILFVSLLVGLDYLADYAGIVRFVTWSLWLSYAEWIFIIGISLLLLRCYRILLRREKFI